jgi:SAM-dependent methyltransferase
MAAVGKTAASQSPAGPAPWRAALPWWAKIAGKLVLSRLPVSGRGWQKLGLFSPGFMLDPGYAVTVFRQHFERAGSPVAGFTFLELGPGDSLATAAVAWAHGAAGGWLVDAGAYAARDIAAYRPLFAKLGAVRDELRLPRDGRELNRCASVDELLAVTHVTYREDGLAGLCAVPAGSVDLVLSQATLEHVPRGEFAATMSALHRLMKPGAVASHQVDFKDHLGASLHNLRFADALWERPWFARRSGFYTNRLRLSEVVAALAAAGFTVEIAGRTQWETVPLPRDRLARQFRDLSDDDLRTSGAALIARKHGA